MRHYFILVNDGETYSIENGQRFKALIIVSHACYVICAVMFVQQLTVYLFCTKQLIICLLVATYMTIHHQVP